MSDQFTVRRAEDGDAERVRTVAESSMTASYALSPRDIEQMWQDQFDWVYREQDYGVVAFTIHPDVAGRPQVLLMLERLIAHMRSHEGVRFSTMDDIALDFIARNPRQV